MVNPQIELIGAADDSGRRTPPKSGRIVPIYEAIGGISSRMLRRIIYAVLENLDGDFPTRCPRKFASATDSPRAATR